MPHPCLAHVVGRGARRPPPWYIVSAQSVLLLGTARHGTTVVVHPARTRPWMMPRRSGCGGERRRVSASSPSGWSWIPRRRVSATTGLPARHLVPIRHANAPSLCPQVCPGSRRIAARGRNRLLRPATQRWLAALGWCFGRRRGVAELAGGPRRARRSRSSSGDKSRPGAGRLRLRDHSVVLAAGTAPAAVAYAVAGDATNLGSSSLNDCAVAAGDHHLLARAAAVGPRRSMSRKTEAVATYAASREDPGGCDGGASVSSFVADAPTTGLEGGCVLAASQLADPRPIHARELAIDELGGVLVTVKGHRRPSCPCGPRTRPTRLASMTSPSPATTVPGRACRARAAVPGQLFVVGEEPRARRSPPPRRRCARPPWAKWGARGTRVAPVGGLVAAPRIDAAGEAVLHRGQNPFEEIGTSGDPGGRPVVSGEAPPGLARCAGGRRVGTHPLRLVAPSTVGRRSRRCSWRSPGRQRRARGRARRPPRRPARRARVERRGGTGSHLVLCGLVKRLQFRVERGEVVIAGVPRTAGEASLASLAKRCRNTRCSCVPAR